MAHRVFPFVRYRIAPRAADYSARAQHNSRNQSRCVLAATTVINLRVRGPFDHYWPI